MVEPLVGSNYYNWKFRMEMILAEHNVLEYVTEETKPSSLTSEPAKKDFKINDNKAKSIIVQCVDDSQLECFKRHAVRVRNVENFGGTL